jgi:hypothetical protein
MPTAESLRWPEPRVVRVQRTRRVLDIFPRCELCGEQLRGAQIRWCSQRCNGRTSMARLHAARALDSYWRTVGLA